MAEKTYIATVQIVLEPGVARTEHAAWHALFALLSGDARVLDWQYLPVGPQRLSPQELLVDPKHYEKGDAFR